MEERNLRKTMTGVVTSDKMDKTVVIAVVQNEMDKTYGKDKRWRVVEIVEKAIIK